MKCRTILATMITFLLLAATPCSANLGNLDFIRLEDWQFDPSATGLPGLPGIFHPIDDIAISGTVFFYHSAPPAPGVSFRAVGAFSVSGFLNDGQFSLDGGLNNSYEWTGIIDFTGVYTQSQGQELLYEITGGAIDIYIDNSMDFGSGDGFFGASDGASISNFQVAGGIGQVEFSTWPSGMWCNDLILDYLRPGVFLDKQGNDLCMLPYHRALVMDMCTNNAIVPPSDPDFIPEVRSSFGIVPQSFDYFIRFDGNISLGKRADFTSEFGTVNTNLELINDTDGDGDVDGRDLYELIERMRTT